MAKIIVAGTIANRQGRIDDPRRREGATSVQTSGGPFPQLLHQLLQSRNVWGTIRARSDNFLTPKSNDFDNPRAEMSQD